MKTVVFKKKVGDTVISASGIEMTVRNICPLNQRVFLSARNKDLVMYDMNGNQLTSSGIAYGKVNFE